MSMPINNMPLNRGAGIQSVRVDTRNYHQIAFAIDGSYSTDAAKLKMMVDGKPVMKRVWELIKENTINALNSLMTSEKNVISSHIYVSITVFQDKNVIELVPSTLLADLDLDEVKAKLETIDPTGETPMGKAIVQTLQRLAAERVQLQATRQMGYPCLVVISDGKPTDDMTEANRIVDELLLLPRPHLTIRAIHIAVNPKENEAALRRLLLHAPNQDVVLLNSGDDFNKYVTLIEQTAMALNGSGSAGTSANVGNRPVRGAGSTPVRPAAAETGNTGGFSEGPATAGGASAPQPVRRRPPAGGSFRF